MRNYDIQKLIDARLERGWDQTTLAFKCQVSTSMVSMIESGKRQSVKTIRKMARKLSVPWSEVYTCNGRRTA